MIFVEVEYNTNMQEQTRLESILLLGGYLSYLLKREATPHGIYGYHTM